MFFQENLADTDALGCHFDQLVVIDELEREFQRHLDRRGQDDVFVGARGAHIRQLLALGRVDDHVLFAGVYADQHALIDIDTMAEEELAAFLQVEEREAQHLAVDHGDHGTVMALAADLTSEEQRTKAMAIIGACIGASFAIALVIGPLLAAAGGLSLVFSVTAGLALIGVAVVVFMVPKPPAAVQVPQTVQRGQVLAMFASPALAPIYFGVFCLHYVLMASFLVVPAAMEAELAIPRDAHWQVYLPVLFLSVLGLLPLMRLGERYGRLRLAMAIAISLLLVSVAALVLGGGMFVYWVALVAFFAAFNYLEATLPSLVSKQAQPSLKGTAMGAFSTNQFLGAFFGGVAGGAALSVGGPVGLAIACVLPGLLWLALLVRLEPVPGANRAETA